MTKYFTLLVLIFFVPYLLFSQSPDHPEGDPVKIDKGFEGSGLHNGSSTRSSIIINAGDAIEGDLMSELAFTPDGNEAWVLHRLTNNITVFDWNTHSISQNIEVGDAPIDIAFSNEYAVVACLNSNNVYIIDLENYSVVEIIETDEQPAKVRVSRDGSLAVVGCDVNDVAEVVDLNTLGKVTTIPNFFFYLYKFSFITSNPRNTVYFSGFEITPDNNYIVNAASDSGCQFINIATGEVDVLIPEVNNSGQVVLSGDGNRLIAAQSGSDALISQVNLNTQSLENQVLMQDVSVFSNYSVPGVNFDGSKAFVSVNPGNTAIVRFDSQDFVPISTGNTPDLVGNSGDYKYAVAGDFYTAIIDFETESLASSLSGISIQNGAVSPSFNRIIASDPLRYEGVMFYEFESPDNLTLLGRSATGSELEADVPYSLTFSPDAKRLIASNSLSGTISVIDVENEELEAIIDLGTSETYQTAFTSDGNYALIAKRLQNNVAIIDMNTLEEVASVSSGGSKPDQVFVLPGNEYAYVLNAGAPDRIGVIELDGTNSSLATTISCGNMGISWTNYGLRSDLLISEDGKYALLSAPFDEKVQVIDLENHQIIKDIEVEGFPLQMAVSDETDLGFFVAVTLKNSSEIAIISGINDQAALIGTYPCGPNPSRISYDPSQEAFVVISNDNKRLEYFSIENLQFFDNNAFSGRTPISVLYDENGGEYVVLRSDDTSLNPHQFSNNGELIDLPSIPIHNFTLTKDGSLAAVAVPGSDEILLVKNEVSRNSFISTTPSSVKVFPNPASDWVSFEFLDDELLGNQLTIQLFNGTGYLVQSLEWNAGKSNLSINTSNFVSGKYYYHLVNDGVVFASGHFHVFH